MSMSENNVFEVPNIRISVDEVPDEESFRDEAAFEYLIKDGEGSEEEEEEEDIQDPPDRDEEDDQDPPPPDEEEEEEERETGDYADYSDAALMALSYKKDGTLPEDLEIDKDLSTQDLKSLIYKASIGGFENDDEAKIALLESRGYTQENKEYVDYLLAGGDPYQVQSLKAEADFTKLEIEDDDDPKQLENRKKIIMAMYKDKNLPASRAEDLYNTLLEKGEDLPESEEGKKYFSEKRKLILQAQKQEAEAVRTAELNKAKKDEEDLKSYIRSKKLGDLEITEYEAKELEKGLFERTETIEYRDQQGKVVKKKVTLYDKKMLDFNKDRNQQLQFALHVLKKGGFNLKNVSTRKKIADEDEFINKINKRKRNVGSSATRGGHEIPNRFLK